MLLLMEKIHRPYLQLFYSQCLFFSCMCLLSNFHLMSLLRMVISKWKIILKKFFLKFISPTIEFLTPFSHIKRSEQGFRTKGVRWSRSVSKALVPTHLPWIFLSFQVCPLPLIIPKTTSGINPARDLLSLIACAAGRLDGNVLQQRQWVWRFCACCANPVDVASCIAAGIAGVTLRVVLWATPTMAKLFKSWLWHICAAPS